MDLIRLNGPIGLIPTLRLTPTTDVFSGPVVSRGRPIIAAATRGQGVSPYAGTRTLPAAGRRTVPPIVCQTEAQYWLRGCPGPDL